MASNMRVDDKLGVDKFRPDERGSHIIVNKTCTDQNEIDVLVKACPAGLYKRAGNGALLFDYLGCLECGTCRGVSNKSAVKEWNYPAGEFGVSYREG